LFGTADAQDVRRLSGMCDKLQVMRATMAHAIEHQVTYIHALDEVTRQNAMDVADLTQILRDSVWNFSLNFHKVEANLSDTQAALEKQARYSAAIREIEMAILELRFSVIQLQESLDVTSLGQLSSVLINPYNLSVILQQVSLQLPAGLSMLTGLAVEDMYVYYTIATVHAVAETRNIRLLVDIPLKATDRYFELYQVHSLPFFHEGIGKFIMIDEAFTYLAVAENRQFFALMTPYMLSKRTQGTYTVCPSDMVLRSAVKPSCLTALFLGKADVVLLQCKRVILDGTFEPVWIRSPDTSYWIYSLSSPQQVTVQCHKMGPPPAIASSYPMLLQGTGILLNSSSCYIHAKSFKLLPHSLGKTSVTLSRTHTVLPNIERILHLSEEKVLQQAAVQPENLQKLDDILVRATTRARMRGIEVTRVIDTLQEEETTSQSISWTWVIGISFIFFVLGILLPLGHKRITTHCPCKWEYRGVPTHRSRQPSQDLNQCEIELQV